MIPKLWPADCQARRARFMWDLLGQLSVPPAILGRSFRAILGYDRLIGAV